MCRWGRFGSFLLAPCLVLPLGDGVDGATVSLRAVERNGVPISPTNNLTVVPGDEIRADMLLSGWGAELPGGIGGYQVVISGSGYFIAEGGSILPKGWCGEYTAQPCSAAVLCPDSFPVCTPGGLCACQSHDPTLGAWIDQTRPDFVLLDCDRISNVATGSLNFGYSAIVVNPFCSTFDTGVHRYLGTLVLVVSADACGVFTIGLDSDASYVVGLQAGSNIVNPVSLPLNVNVAGCETPPVECDPQHCSIDARIPHSPTDSTSGYTWTSLTMHFAGPVGNPSIEDFDVLMFPENGTAPAIASFIAKGNDATLTLDRGIQAGAWTCIRQATSNLQCCIASLPGDVDNDRVAQESDILELLDNLRGETLPNLPLEQCDTDRTNICTGADLLSTVDLLTGAEAFQAFDGIALPDCPPTRADP